LILGRLEGKKRKTMLISTFGTISIGPVIYNRMQDFGLKAWSQRTGWEQVINPADPRGQDAVATGLGR